MRRAAEVTALWHAGTPRDVLEIRPVPCEIPETDIDRIDWYRLIAQKQ